MKYVSVLSIRLVVVPLLLMVLVPIHGRLKIVMVGSQLAAGKQIERGYSSGPKCVYLDY